MGAKGFLTSHEASVHCKSVIEQCLRGGFMPFRQRGGPGSSVREAARRMDVDVNTLSAWVCKQERLKAQNKDNYLPDWSLLNKPEAVATQPVPEQVEPPPSDPIDLRRLKDEVLRLRASLAGAERRAADAEDIRAGVLGLLGEPLKPRLVLPVRKDGGDGGRSVILHLSDIHYGEMVSLEEMDGVNKYNLSVARSRLGRFFDKASSLMTEHWSGPPPDEIVLCLGGDLISGGIHPELRETDELPVPATVREVGEHIAGGIVALRSRVQCPVRCYSVPGNHGRITLKPQSKGRAGGSLDLLATDFAEATFRGAGLDGVTFYRTASPDAHFSVYGWHILLNHGDSMGGRGGGTGFIGPLAVIMKGHRKLVDTSWRSGRPVHLVLTAHYHTTGKTAFGYANGSVIGYGEYARDLRADPEGSRQNMLVVHHRHGVINHQELHLGVPSEGSHYAGPATLVRPEIGDMD